MTIKQKTTVSISVAGEATSPTRCEVHARNHTIIIDEPAARHGTDQGPTPLETLLSAFAGCTNVILNKIAGEQSIMISDMKISVIGHLDHRGIDGQAMVSNVFPEIDLKIDCRMRGAPADLSPLQQQLRQRCPVSVILRASGSSIKEEWNVTRD
jgi:uncharacterized OsmC-like protein